MISQDVGSVVLKCKSIVLKSIRSVVMRCREFFSLGLGRLY